MKGEGLSRRSNEKKEVRMTKRYLRGLLLLAAVLGVVLLALSVSGGGESAATGKGAPPQRIDAPRPHAVEPVADEARPPRLNATQQVNFSGCRTGNKHQRIQCMLEAIKSAK